MIARCLLALTAAFAIALFGLGGTAPDASPAKRVGVDVRALTLAAHVQDISSYEAN